MITDKIILNSLLVAIFLALSVPTLAYSQDQNILQKTNRPISSINDDLSKIRVNARDVDISPAVSALFTELKHALRDLISETINDRSANWQSAKELEAIISLRLTKEGMRMPEQTDDNEKEETEYSYEQHQDITVESPKDHADLLVITSTFWVMCGSDTSFYLFRKNGDKWILILSEEAKDYKDIIGAHSRFGYSISPPDKKGNFYIVTANINPWCTSFWQGLRYAVYRPGPAADKPKNLLRGEATIYIGVDPPVFKIFTTAKSFKLEFKGDWYSNPEDGGASEQYVIYNVSDERADLEEKGKVAK